MSENRIRIAGFDPSFRNWGMSFGWLYLDELEYTIDTFKLVQTKKNPDKKVKKNKCDMESAYQLQKGVLEAIEEQKVAMIFAEVPTGSQSYRSGFSLGVVLGTMAALRVRSIPVVDLQQNQLKMAAVGKTTATKDEMIAWARGEFPDAPWLVYPRNGGTFKKGDYDDGKNEHLADSVAAIEAGLGDPEFLSILGILRAQARG